MFDLTHNDLHTNNVMYKKTDKTYLYYRYKGDFYKVPTHGRIYKIIDFGRAIYRYKGKRICSDSFHPKGDASTQYNCEPYLNENKPGITDINSIIFKDEGKIFNINNVEEYISKVLPLKAQLTQLNYKKVSKIDQLSIIAISIVALLHYQFSLRIISKFFLSCNNYEIRKRLNNLLSVEIF